MTADERYILEKLHGVIETLATNAHGIKVRLDHVATELVIACIPNHDLGPATYGKIETLIAGMTTTEATHGEGQARASFAAMSEEEATAFAARLFELYATLHELEVEDAFSHEDRT
jgi:hypothetical protein